MPSRFHFGGALGQGGAVGIGQASGCAGDASRWATGDALGGDESGDGGGGVCVFHGLNLVAPFSAVKQFSAIIAKFLLFALAK